MPHNKSLLQWSKHALLATALGLATTGAQSSGFLEKLTRKTNEPVEPELAFSVKGRTTGPQQMAIEFSIRPDYYLYRERISVILKDSPGWRINAQSRAAACCVF